MEKVILGLRNPLALALLMLLFCLPLALLSQSEVPVIPQIRITDRTQQRYQPMKLKELSVEIRIMGQMAVTTLDMIWFNSNPMILEGAFEFPLAEGQSVSGFALDINGKMRKGVVLEKEKGRAVFEAIVRRNVDPGLLEVTAGNNYRARIYPLPPHGTRRIMITVEQELTPGKNEDYYTLPLQIQDKVDRFSLRVEVMKRPVRPVESSDVMGGLVFSQVEESLVVEKVMKNYVPDRSVSLLLPREQTTTATVGFAEKIHTKSLRISGWWIPVMVFLTGVAIALLLFIRRRKWVAGIVAAVTVLSTGMLGWREYREPEKIHPAVDVVKALDYQFWTAGSSVSDSSWFYINVSTPVTSGPLQNPQNITLLWDVSGSGSQRDHEKEKSLLSSLLEQYQDVDITLIPYHIQKENNYHFRIQQGNAESLIHQIDQLDYDGASATPDPGWIAPDCDEILLFSDGIFNFREAVMKGYKVPVHTICASKVADYTLLQHLASSTGGSFINLMETSHDHALEKLTHRVLRLVSTEIMDGKALSLFPSGPAPVGHILSMAGVMQGASLKLRLNFGYGSTVEYSEYLTVKADGEDDPALLQRIWAGKMLKELLWNPESNRSRIVDAAKHYGFVTPFTSLIVLEELSDYIQYKIVPPPDLPEDFRSAYFRELKVKESVENDLVKGLIDNLVMQMDEQTSWWNTVFKPEPVPVPDPVPGPGQDALPVAGQQEVAPAIEMTEQAMPPMIRADTAEVNQHQVSVDPLSVSGASMMPFSVQYSAINYDATQSFNAGLTAIPGAQSPIHATTAMEEAPVYASSSIELKTWNPDAPYMAKLRRAPAQKKYRTYLQLKQTYYATPAFFNDVAEYFRQQKLEDLAIRVISNLAEVGLESPELLRTLGNKLMDYRQHQEAIYIFRKVLSVRGEDPQSLRDLGQALEAGGAYNEAVKILYRIITGEEDFRCTSLKVIVMNDINKILATHPATCSKFIDKRLIRKEPVDVRVVLTWDLDDTDMDLWVTDPRGETCMYSNALTAAGGKITHDVTRGYGPEEFMIRKAVKGTYSVQAHWYGSSTQGLLVPANLHLTFYTHYGRKNGRQKEVTIRLEELNNDLMVGRFEFR